jgi:hypothetical protein
MGVAAWVTLIISIATTIVIAMRSVAVQGAKAVELLTIVKEKVSICQVGIEALRMVDTDTINKIEELELKVLDLERYLELASAGQYPHAYTPRGKGRKPRA